VKGCGNASKKKLASTAENDHVVRRRDFGNGGTHHLVINLAVFFEPGKLFRSHRELLIDNVIHRLAVDELELESICGCGCDFAAAATGQPRNRDNRHML